MAGALFGVALDLVELLRSGLRSHTRLAAENLFLRKQLALYIERSTKPRRASQATRRAVPTDILHFPARVVVIAADAPHRPR